MALRRALATDYDEVVRILARAFDRDPVAKFLLRQDAKRARAYELAFGAFFRHAVLPHREAWIHDDGGVALWTPPEKWNVGLGQLIVMGPSLLGAVGITRAVFAARAGNRVQAKHPTKPHWYLFAIGVDPEKQGRGIGSELLREMLVKCDAEKSAAYLEASTEANARLYARHGFEVTEEVRMTPDAPPVRLMWREPHA